MMSAKKVKNSNEVNIYSSRNYNKTNTKMNRYYPIPLSSMAITTPVALL